MLGEYNTSTLPNTTHDTQDWRRTNPKGNLVGNEGWGKLGEYLTDLWQAKEEEEDGQCDEEGHATTTEERNLIKQSRHNSLHVNHLLFVYIGDVSSCCVVTCVVVVTSRRR